MFNYQEKKIHGKMLHTTNDGKGIYYDNVLIADLSISRPINYHTNFEYWVKRISENPNFDPKKATNLFK